MIIDIHIGDFTLESDAVASDINRCAWVQQEMTMPRVLEALVPVYEGLVGCD